MYKIKPKMIVTGESNLGIREYIQFGDDLLIHSLNLAYFSR